MNVVIARATLERLFAADPGMLLYIDNSPTSSKITYLNETLILALQKGLPHLKPYSAVLPEHEGGERICNTNTTTTAKSLAPYKMYSGSVTEVLPEAQSFKGSKLGLIKVLLGSRQLLSQYGLQISTIKIANQLGVSQQAVWKHRRQLLRQGWLHSASRAYIPNEKAMRFTAAGPLRIALRTLYPAASFQTDLPKSIPDGEWNKTLGVIIGRLSWSLELEEVMKLIRTIEGSHFGDRMSQTKNWYRWWTKKRTTLAEQKHQVGGAK